MSHIYWSILSVLLGACIGSFLNVVAYRWPRNLSIMRPSRSFCPNCGHDIHWYENIPVLSYVSLGGRCRSCRQPISMQYPLVEIVTALTFLMTYDAFFVARQRQGITSIEADWPILLAHWALWAGMIALTVMDLEAYMVDIRVTWVVSAIGIVAHTFWTPTSSAEWIRPGAAGSAMAFAATIGLGIGALLFLRRDTTLVSEDGQLDAHGPPEVPMKSAAPAPSHVPVSTWITLALLVACVLAFLVWFTSAGEQVTYRPGESIPLGDDTILPPASPLVWQDAGAVRLFGAFALLFIVLTWAGTRPEREADVEIVEAIHAESSSSRRTALAELKLISPAVILGVGALCLLPQAELLRGPWERCLHWSPNGSWQPIWGLSTALFGWVIGGAMGWVCRIFFTLVLGKEALGMGDVHILAAAGAVAGWPVAVFGFFAASLLALLAMLVIQFRRRSRAIPYGPWLAIAFLLCCIFQDRILAFLGIRWMLSAPVFSSRVLGVQP